MQAEEIHLHFTLLDRAWFDLHNGSNGNATPKSGFHAAAGRRALALPFRGASFDLVSCNLYCAPFIMRANHPVCE